MDKRKPLVTIGLPVYKRLEYLPHVLKIINSQEYSEIELLVSDNGQNGTIVSEIVSKYYGRPYTFRQNVSTVPISVHFNQLVEEARGEYFVVLADDDEITVNYVSELVRLLEQCPSASVALSIQETIDVTGKVISRSKNTVPELLRGEEFVEAAWGTHEYEYESFSTFLARTKTLRTVGGFPEFRTGTGDDDALVLKLCLDSLVVFSSKCVFRKRYSEASDGYAISIFELALGLRDFLEFLKSDAVIKEYRRFHPVEWKKCSDTMTSMIWKTYYSRWCDLYSRRLPAMEWARAGFYLPWIPRYYRMMLGTLCREMFSHLIDQLEVRLPVIYRFYRTVHPKRR